MKIIPAISAVALVAISTFAIPARAADPDFGPNVLIFDPSMTDIQAKADAISAHQTDEGRDQFTTGRYALLFKPGKYAGLDVKVGFYMQVMGLGKSPDDVEFTSGLGPHSSHYGNVTQTFWRAIENFSFDVAPPNRDFYWGVSQGASMRRIHVKGPIKINSEGWASGGFLADCKVEGGVNSGSQQQWFSRNAELGKWSNGVWNMVFVGVPNAPSTWSPYTEVDKTPLMAEKPYLYIDDSGHYSVMVPAVKKDSAGTSWGTAPTAGKSIPIDKFYIAHAGKDTAATINAALDSGKNLLLTPGIYHLEAAINVTRADTIVMGIGYATLIPDKGTPALKIANVNGVRVGALLLEASTTKCPTLLQVGEPGDKASRAENPTIIYDIFARVGGAGPGNADCMVTINSNDVIGDNAWLWRADHGAGATWDGAVNNNGLIVNGKNVIYYGLAVEHTQEYQTMWNADGGRVYFYQSEMPYDVPDGQKGWASYKITNDVKTHQAWGVGIYQFNHGDTVAADAIESPEAPGIKFTHIVLFGNKKGSITNMVNATGPGIGASNKATMDVWPAPAPVATPAPAQTQ